MDPETLYLQLRRLVASMPELNGEGPITPEINQWLGRATALVEAGGNVTESVKLHVAGEGLNTVLRSNNAQTIASILYRALARAELNAPASAQGAFIAAGKPVNGR